jgi:hypothetical protein
MTAFKKFSLFSLLLISSLFTACSGSEFYYDNYGNSPTSPGYPPGGGGYNPGPYPDGPARDVLGEWEGFIWETWRSDNLPRSKKTMAVRFTNLDSIKSFNGYKYYADVNVLIDGRPASNSRIQVYSGGYVDFQTLNSKINLALNGRFYNDRGDGEVHLEWDEKIEVGHPPKVDLHFVRLNGDFEVSRASGGHWGAAWKLFDTYGDGVWDIGDETWGEVSREGITLLENLAEANNLLESGDYLRYQAAL